MTRLARPTLADVAERAGVSLKTASRALNGEYGVAEATATRVREAARQLGFRLNQIARSLAAGGASAAVGLLLSDLADPFIAAVAGSVESLLAPRELQLLTASHYDDEIRQRRIVRTFVERRVDALILVPAPGDMSYLTPEIEHGLVVAAIDRPLDGVDVDTAVVDNAAGAAEAVARLAARGHRRIAALGNDSRLWTLRERHAGYRAGLAAAGLDYDPGIVDLDCRDAAGAERVMRHLLALDNPPTAVFAAQHMAGRGTVRTMHQTGIALDLAVFDELVDTDLLVSPPVVVVASGPDRLGRVGARMVVERLDGLTEPARRLVLPCLFLEQGQAYTPFPVDETLPAPATVIL
jgi:LacI family transcriptional regulator